MKHALILLNHLAGANAELMVECGVAAEQAGWDAVLLADHMAFPPPPAGEVYAEARSTSPESSSPPEYLDFLDPWIILTGIAARTDRIRLGTWITPVARRQPWQTARDLATLDRLSNGRVMLGAGLGRRTEFERFGEPWNPRVMARKLDEALDIIARFWSGERVSFHGEHYLVDDVAVLPIPRQKPRIPILTAGIWPNRKPFERAARWDGMMPHFPGDGVVPGDGSTSPEAAVEALMDCYHGLVVEPGDVFLPADPPNRSSSYRDVCEACGVTWLWSDMRDDEGNRVLDLDRIRQGPPKQ